MQSIRGILDVTGLAEVFEVLVSISADTDASRSYDGVLPNIKLRPKSIETSKVLSPSVPQGEH